jgi:hypothetical protein
VDATFVCGKGRSRRKRSGSTKHTVLRVKRATSSSPCTVVLSSFDEDKPSKQGSMDEGQKEKIRITDANIEEVRVQALLDNYDMADMETKRTLVDLARRHGDKLVGGDEESKQKLAKLIQYGDLNDHVGLVEASKKVHDTGLVPRKVANSHQPPDLTTPLNLMKNTRFSQSKMAAALVSTFNSKGMKGYTQGAEKVTNAVGKFLLAKNIVQGLSSGNFESLAITGGIVAVDFIKDGIVSHGTHVFKATGKMPKLPKFVGKFGGIATAGIDVGMSAWGLSKSVGRLKNPNATKWERNEAIADIVQDSIDIVVTIAVTVLSMAFPPAAPLLAVVGFFISIITSFSVSLYKKSQMAQNHVDEINSKIRLLDWEKGVEKDRYKKSRGTSEYLERLLFTKNGNNLVVQHWGEVMKNDTNIIGVAIPSREYSRKEECFVEKKSCTSFRRGACASYGRFEILKYEYPVNLDIKCPSPIPRVTSRSIEWCKCKPKPVWGYPNLNNVVDFRKKQTVYWNRDVPDDMKGLDYRCKPNSLSFQGDQVSERVTNSDYNCQNAISIWSKYWNRNEGAGYFLFQLEDGNDDIYMDEMEKLTNAFWVGNGMKRYSGGAGRDQFIVSGNCENLKGTLDGGRGSTDTLIITETCNSSGAMVLSNGAANNQYYMTSQDRPSPKVHVQLINMEVIIGRPNLPDYFTISCLTLKVDGRGGLSESAEDLFFLPANKQNCPYNLTLNVGRFSKVESKARFGQIMMWIGGMEDEIWEFVGNFSINGGSNTTLILGTEASAVELTEFKCGNNSHYYYCSYVFLDARIGTQFRLTSEQEVKVEGNFNYTFDIRFNERQGSPSLILMDGTNGEITGMAHHLFADSVDGTNNNNRLFRAGSNFWPNTYIVHSGYWYINGSKGDNINDTFILKPGAKGYFAGGGGGGNDNTLRVIEEDTSNNGNASAEIVLELNPRGQGDSNKAVVGMTGINRIFGRNGARERIVLNLVKQEEDCNNKVSSRSLVIAGGGGGKTSMDLIQIHDEGGFNNDAFVGCDNDTMSVTIVAEGSTRIEGILGKNNVSLVALIVPDSEDKGYLRFESEFNVSREKLVSESSFYFQIQVETLKNVVVVHLEEKERSSLRIRMNFSSNQHANIVFQLDSSSEKVKSVPTMLFLNDESALVAQLGVDLSSGEAYLLHTLNSEEEELAESVVVAESIINHSRSRLGSRGVVNVFQLEGGRWNVTGGRQNDTFLLRSEEFLGGWIDGGSGGIMNSLVISPELYENETLTVDLLGGELLVGNEGILGLKGINSITGRDGLPEVILVGTDTSFVSSGGGNETDFDQIIISGEVKGYREVTFNISEYTELQNVGGAAAGSFRYIVNSPKVILSIGENSQQNFVQFRMDLDWIRKVEFESKNGSSGSRIWFQMSEFSNNEDLFYESSFHLSTSEEEEASDEEDFVQPGFQLVELKEMNDSSIERLIECDIRVKLTGQIYTSIVFRGEGQLQQGIGGIPGAENNFVVSLSNSTVLESLVGHERNDNFWIGSAASILLLDGGEGNNSEKGEETQQKNSLHLMDSFASGIELTVYLAPFGQNGSVLGISSLGGEDGGDFAEIEFIPTLRNIQNFHGRPGWTEKVFVACDTSYLEEVEEIVISDWDCPEEYDLVMRINNRTEEVQFSGDYNVDNANSSSSWAGSFQYRFDGVFSFDINIVSSTLANSLSSATSHTFVFDFGIASLESLWFIDESLQYSIGNETFSHKMAFPLESTDEFYSNPQFVTKDGFRIQITRYGEIILILGNPSQTEEKLDLETIQKSLVPFLQGIGNKLEVSIIVRTKEDLFMVGYNISEDAHIDERNVLTNGPMRSHLLGGGSGRTMYEIISLDEDIFIYSGFDGSNPLARQIIDMTDLVGSLRLVTKTKYVPTVGREGPHLLISMKGYEWDYKGRIWLMDGVAYASQFDLQLNSAMMEILPLRDDRSKLRRKRSLDIESEWKISPKPLAIPLGLIYTVSAEDLEEGQDIIMLMSEDDGEMVMMPSMSEFTMVRSGNDMIMTNMGGNRSTEGIIRENLTSFVVADFYLQREDRRELDEFHNVKVHLSENSSLVLNGTHVFRLSLDGDETSFLLEGLVNPLEGEAIQWKEFLQEVETEMLAEVPEVKTRRYVILPPTELKGFWVVLLWMGGGVMGGVLVGFFGFVFLRYTRRVGVYELWN